MKLVARPICTKGKFRFTHEFVEKTWKELIMENPNRPYMNLPGDWLFTNRLQWGLFSILSTLKAEIP